MAMTYEQHAKWGFFQARILGGVWKSRSNFLNKTTETCRAIEKTKRKTARVKTIKTSNGDFRKETGERGGTVKKNDKRNILGEEGKLSKGRDGIRDGKELEKRKKTPKQRWVSRVNNKTQKSFELLQQR